MRNFLLSLLAVIVKSESNLWIQEQWDRDDNDAFVGHCYEDVVTIGNSTVRKCLFLKFFGQKAGLFKTKQ